MDWMQILTLILTNIGFVTALFFWSRSESRADARRCEDLIAAIQAEIKDFHGRLCDLEARNKK